ncbi:hypothetical protein C8R42DRAFT_646229 [Lentinula raphanica]|nr:hypothetical protein C8R42DRAFT_646229 [Lentinula raphanica]
MPVAEFRVTCIGLTCAGSGFPSRASRKARKGISEIRKLIALEYGCKRIPPNERRTRISTNFLHTLLLLTGVDLVGTLCSCGLSTRLIAHWTKMKITSRNRRLAAMNATRIWNLNGKRDDEDNSIRRTRLFEGYLNFWDNESSWPLSADPPSHSGPSTFTLSPEPFKILSDPARFKQNNGANVWMETFKMEGMVQKAMTTRRTWARLLEVEIPEF